MYVYDNQNNMNQIDNNVPFSTKSYGMSSTSSSSSSSKKHPIYRGIRCRGEKWVSEIREPGKSNRIWLGTFLTPDMAAAAYDVASLALKGSKAILNFPNLAHKYPIPASSSPDDIRNAATKAAHLFIKRVVQDDHDQSHQLLFGQYHNDDSMNIITSTDQMTSTFTTNIDQQEFVDEEALFSMPNLLMDMAQGLLLSPPRLNLNSQPSCDSQEYISDGCESLWN